MDLGQVDEGGLGPAQAGGHRPGFTQCSLERSGGNLRGDRAASEREVRLVNVHGQAAQHGPVQLSPAMLQGPLEREPRVFGAAQGETALADKKLERVIARVVRNDFFQDVEGGAMSPGDEELHGELVALPQRPQAQKLHVQ